MTKHTPGPWLVNSGQRGSFYITAENDTAIAQTYEPKQSMRVLTGAADAEANARLIAAAPDMAAALKDCLKLIEDMSRFIGVMALKDYALFNEGPIKARAALKKAAAGA